MYFPAVLFISLLWNKGKKKKKGEAEQRGSHGWGSRCEGLGDTCSRVTFSSAFTLILSFCPYLIFSFIFFFFYHFFILLHPFLLSVSCRCFPLFSFSSLLFPSCWSAFVPQWLLFPHSSSPPIPSQKHSKLIAISGSLGCLLQRDEPPCCCFQNSWKINFTSSSNCI